MSEVLGKAQELADAISVSEELTSLREAAELLDKDEMANATLKTFQEKQEVVHRAASSGIQLPEEQMSELQSMQGRIRDIPTVQVFAAAQSSFNDLMGQVNDIIAAAVMGSEPDSSNDNCGPGCSCGH